ncbi:MAG: putative lipid II flippase FtsW [Candidatus Marinimicrobia bacterium]|nr:putative lipid II flippase FtsW [Candidatus Neomarinimicrobiota bacterium]MCF7829625.1 putative lipid II flippase FtsW [Candidatus Neomarinimicrobiota bacterium]MCF7879785.1 putative lipid II flippase FtsW [Candidatus Neomarinimicrobiota bacterium]
MRKEAETYDRMIFIVVFLLIGIGTVMLYSSSSTIAAEKYGNAGFFLRRHAMRLLLGMIAMFLMMRFDYHKFQKYSPLIYVGSILLLLVTLGYYWSNNIESPARWLPLGFFSLQTSDVAKFAIIIYLAAYLSRQGDLIREFKHGLAPAIIMIALCIGLIAIQPDFSTAATVAAISLFLLFLGRAKIWHLASIVGVFGMMGTAVVLTSSYKLERVITFLNPGSNLSDSGYQIQQSLISLGNGGLFGMGLGDSYEKNLFLPEPHTDFIFAIIGEELGFIGAVAVLFLFLLFFLQSLRIARQAKDLFGMYLAAGLSAAIFIYAAIHAGVVTGLLPTTGLPLPFMSYGGSQLVTGMAAIGVILNISSQRKRKEVPPVW